MIRGKWLNTKEGCHLLYTDSTAWRNCARKAAGSTGGRAYLPHDSLNFPHSEEINGGRRYKRKVLVFRPADAGWIRPSRRFVRVQYYPMCICSEYMVSRSMMAKPVSRPAFWMAKVRRKLLPPASSSSRLTSFISGNWEARHHVFS